MTLCQRSCGTDEAAVYVAFMLEMWIQNVGQITGVMKTNVK